MKEKVGQMIAGSPKFIEGIIERIEDSNQGAIEAGLSEMGSESGR